MATIDGVVRLPSALGITTGSPPSITATQRLVVPRSMPMTLLMRRSPPLGGRSPRWHSILAGLSTGAAATETSAGRTSRSVQGIAPHHLRDDRAWRGVGGHHASHGLVLRGIEWLAHRDDRLTP